jgi:hypothetical protein
MNNFCIDLNLDIPIFNTPIDVSNYNGPRHSRANNLSSDIYALFDNLNLAINLAETFYIPKFDRLKIHEDGGEKPDVLKINWVLGGENSLMNWYTPTKEPVWEKTILGIPYKYYRIDQVKLIHSQAVGYPSLLQVGCPHNVVTTTHSRFCLSIVPMFKDSKQLLTFEQGKEIFKNFIK